MAITLFLAYAREDEAFANILESLLARLEQNNSMSFYKHDIGQIESEAGSHLGEASVVLLLISPDFLNSDYVYSNEIARAIERHKQGATHVFPIILRPVYWGRTPFAQLQVIPKSATPITLWEKQEVAFEEVIATIEHAVKESIEEDSFISGLRQYHAGEMTKQLGYYNDLPGERPMSNQEQNYYAYSSSTGVSVCAACGGSGKDGRGEVCGGCGGTGGIEGVSVCAACGGSGKDGRGEVCGGCGGTGKGSSGKVP